MNCDEVKRSLQDYVTRELDPERRRLFDAHVVECGECQRELALMSAVVSTLDHQPVLNPGPGFSARVMRSLPKDRVFLLSPWWSLVLAPILGGIAWLFRVPLDRGIAGLFGRYVPGTIAMPALTMQGAGIAAAVIVGVGLLVAAGGAAFCWRVYLLE
jgi:anti-sigma factor RsiW